MRVRDHFPIILIIKLPPSIAKNFNLPQSHLGKLAAHLLRRYMQSMFSGQMALSKLFRQFEIDEPADCIVQRTQETEVVRCERRQLVEKVARTYAEP